jgi:tetratricopeptide (TPR) repeat protein
MTVAAPCRLALLVALCLVLAAVPALGKKSEEEKSAETAEPSVLQLESKALARHPEVLEALRNARAHPDDAEAYDHLGQVLSSKGGYLDAIEAFEHAAGLAPGNQAYRNNLGVALLKTGEASKALKTFEEALEIDALDPVTHYNLGVANQAAGNYDKALESFETAFLLDPDLADPEKNPAVVNNPNMMAINLRVYLRTVGSNPGIYKSTDEN